MTPAPQEPLVLVMPLPPNVANGRGHWRTRRNAQHAYWETCDVLRHMGRLPYRVNPMERATIAAHFAVWSLMDEDNLMARAKHALDWLKRRGYIVDDNAKRLTWSAVPTQSVNRKTQSLTLTLTPID